ncbi:MAG: hypothetical protein DMG14_19085 [Acidobacteria bacterium]|nr:MAG: hypothetical protein DMG14_19085 [Acidobacteriota bacterium]
MTVRNHSRQRLERRRYRCGLAIATRALPPEAPIRFAYEIHAKQITGPPSWVAICGFRGCDRLRIATLQWIESQIENQYGL